MQFTTRYARLAANRFSGSRRGGTGRILLGAMAVTLALVAATGITAPTASAQPDSGSAFGSSDPDNDFYADPGPLPDDGAPGDIIRSQRFDLTLSVPGPNGPLPAAATRIMYRSNDTNDQPAPVTGTYLEPSLPWTGPGPRPLVAVAPGTQGQGPQCAPSKTLGELIHYTFPLDIWVTSYEVTTAYSLLARGMAVVMTDYYGFVDGQVHDYVNRLSGAHAVLDSIRAAETLTGTHPPAAIFGYSEGGNAAAAAAELQPGYAPDIDLVGSYVGAPPADLRAMVDTSQVIVGVIPGFGGLGPGLLGYVLNGFEADYPQSVPIVDQFMNARGHRMMAEMRDSCVAELGLRTMFRPLTVYTRDGLTIQQVLDRSPELSRLVDEQRIGTLEPGAPVLIATNAADDVIPYAQVRQLASDWCANGATVQLDTTTWLPSLLPSLAVNHALGFVPALAQAMDWITQRLAGAPAPTDCDALP